MENRLKSLINDKLKVINKLRVFVMIVFIICTFIAVLQPYLLGKIIDGLTNSSTDIYTLFLVTFLLIVLSFLLDWIQNYYWFMMIYKGYSIVRAALFGEVLKNDYTFFRKHQKGDLTNRIINDSTQYAEKIIITMPIAILNISTLLFVFSFLFIMNRVLASIVLVASIIYFFYYKMLNSKLEFYTKKERESFSNVLSSTDDILEGVDTIQLFKSEKYFMGRFKDDLKNQYNLLMNLQKWKSLGLCGTQFIVNIIPLIVMFVGAKLLMESKTTIGIIFSFYTYIGFLNQPIRNLTSLNLTVQQSKAVEERLKKLISSDSTNHTVKKSVNAIKSIQFSDVSYSHSDGNSVISNLNFHFKKGDVVLISGPSGIGKTTLIRILMNQVSATSGQVLINDTNVEDVNMSEYREHIAVLPQNIFIFHGSKQENITFGNNYKMDRLSIVEHLPFIKPLPKDEIKNYSGGEKQRIGVARVLIKDADLIILDEPTSALDTETEIKVLEALMDPASNTDKIVMVISHRDIVANYCTHELRLSEHCKWEVIKLKEQSF